MKLLITIDGPSSAGKSTISKLVSKELSYKYIDTGALYRGIAYELLKAQIDADDDKKLQEICDNIDFYFEYENDELNLFSKGQNISSEIRSEEVSMLASKISAKIIVRNALLDFQRNLGKNKSMLFEGRDMGTVVFPDADIKFFLTAKSRVRAERRYKDLLGQNPSITIDEIEENIKKRDEKDSTRKHAPLKMPQDAILIETDDLTIDEVVDKIVTIVKSSF